MKNIKNMKIATLAATFFCLIILPIYAALQGQNIQTVRHRYATIDANLRHYSRVKRELMGYSTEGGDLKAYFAGSAPRKVVVQFFGCRHQVRTEYYFWNNRLFFVYQVRLQDTGVHSRKVLSRKENRFYFKQGQLVCWLGVDKTQLRVTSPEARQQERELLKDAREWLALANRLVG